MTLAQVMEMRRLTPGMSELLHHIGEKIEADVCAPYLRTARLLERRGFLAMIKRSTDGFTSFRLTEAGREALSGRVAAHGARHTTAHFPPPTRFLGPKNRRGKIDGCSQRSGVRRWLLAGVFRQIVGYFNRH